MENRKLTGHQKSHLRGLGQRLEPVLSVGRGGVTPAVLKELERALAAHELVKVRLLAERDARGPLMESLAAGTGSEIVGSVGRAMLLYRPSPRLAGNRIILPGRSVD